MKINFSKQAIKAINKIDRFEKQRIKAGIEKLPDGDTKQYGLMVLSLTGFVSAVGGFCITLMSMVTCG